MELKREWRIYISKNQSNFKKNISCHKICVWNKICSSTYGVLLRSKISIASCKLSNVATCGKQLNKDGSSKLWPYSKGLTLITRKFPEELSPDLLILNRYSSSLTFVKLNFEELNGWEIQLISSGARLFSCRSGFSCWEINYCWIL